MAGVGDGSGVFVGLGVFVLVGVRVWVGVGVNDAVGVLVIVGVGIGFCLFFVLNVHAANNKILLARNRRIIKLRRYCFDMTISLPKK